MNDDWWPPAYENAPGKKEMLARMRQRLNNDSDDSQFEDFDDPDDDQPATGSEYQPDTFGSDPFVEQSALTYNTLSANTSGQKKPGSTVKRS